MTPTGERAKASRRLASVEMTSILSRTAGSLPRRGATRSVPADRRRTPNAMTDSMSLQAVTPEAVADAPERTGGRRARGGQDRSGTATGSRTGPRTGPKTARGTRDAGRSDEPLADRGPAAGPAGESRGLKPGPDAGGARGGQHEDGPRTRFGGSAAALDPLTDPEGRGAREAVRSGDDARPAGRGRSRSGTAGSEGRAGGSGRRFAAAGVEDALELGEDEAERPPTSRRGPAADGDAAADDRLAWFRHGWLGPLAVAVVVALVSLGIYVLVVGRGGGGHSGASDTAATAILSPVGTNPDAKVGKAMADGTYNCIAGAAPAAPSASTGTTPGAAGPSAAAGPAPGAHAGVLIVPPTNGKYQWNGQQGDYTIATPTFDDASNVIAAVAFTSGPLQGQVGNSIAVWPAGGRAQATMQVTKGGNMSCALN
ncbi:hypothetical protein [Pseudofrankia asymbiotica]|uniref:Uncharacterized protein n=1 Tax=Pseudofrankia asymbiotica TaxID=1834516 RepID=A0A1V2II62_9ACTN|nr:hypothetical protein [Pseudofrankia asymbiotica]ONH32121.1 hypothetical protein BL253_06420 [Pseudofrankia asymbiotica]